MYDRRGGCIGWLEVHRRNIRLERPAARRDKSGWHDEDCILCGLWLRWRRSYYSYRRRNGTGWSDKDTTAKNLFGCPWSHHENGRSGVGWNRSRWSWSQNLLSDGEHLQCSRSDNTSSTVCRGGGKWHLPGQKNGL